MPLAVSWRLMFRANNATAADRCLSRVIGCIPATVHDGPKPYWKRPELWEVTLATVFASPAADGVFGLLGEADRLGSGWLVTGPLMADGEVTVFEGIFNAGLGRPHIAGLGQNKGVGSVLPRGSIAEL